MGPPGRLGTAGGDRPSEWHILKGFGSMRLLHNELGRTAAELRHVIEAG